MRLTLTRNVLSFIAAICGGVANGGRGEFAGVDAVERAGVNDVNDAL